MFGLFCIIMMADQLSAILDNTPGIDALQHKHGAKRGRYDSLKAVFGEPLGLRWLAARAPARSGGQRLRPGSSQWTRATTANPA